LQQKEHSHDDESQRPQMPQRRSQCHAVDRRPSGPPHHLHVIVPVAPRGLEALLPQQPKTGQPAPSETIVVQILAGPAGPIYRINDQCILGKTQLVAELSRIYSIRAEKVLFVKGDPTLDFASVAAVIDISRALGIDHVGIITPRLAAS
jgi:biopolymer transport protein ExbD